MMCCSVGPGIGADELGAGADEEGAEGTPPAPVALLEGAGAFADPAKPCTASTMTSGGRLS